MLDKTRLKGTISKFAQEFSAIAGRSRDEYMRGLKAGDRMPPEGRLYGEDFRRQFAEVAQQYGNEARELVEARENEIRALMAAAPSQEAANTISLLKMRNSVTEEEMNAAFDAYGDNYQCYMVLEDICEDNKIPVAGEHPLKVEAEGLESLKKSLDSVFSVTGAENGRLGDGFLSMLEAQIDNVESNSGFFG